jgi:hypothetical protein
MYVYFLEDDLPFHCRRLQSSRVVYSLNTYILIRQHSCKRETWLFCFF